MEELASVLGKVAAASGKDFRVNIIHNNYYGRQAVDESGLGSLFGALLMASAFQAPELALDAPAPKETLQLEGTVAAVVEPTQKFEDAEYTIVENEPSVAKDPIEEAIRYAARSRIQVQKLHHTNVFEDGIYFEHLRLDYDVDWKNIVRSAEFHVPFLIITLDRDLGESGKTEYTSLYSCSPRFAKKLVSPRSNDRFITIGENFSQNYFIEALKETALLNGGRPFYYIEELDTTNCEESDLILGGDSPKTEVYPVQSMFPFKPSITYSNFKPFVFQVEPKGNTFKIVYGKV